MTSAQVSPQTRTVVVNGRTGNAKVLQLNGQTYVDLESLARIGDGSLTFQGNQIALVVPGRHTTAPSTDAVDRPAARSSLSPQFRESAIESLARMREWASTIANALQNGYPITESWAADYREKAATSLRQASAAASTDSDHNALALLTNEFQNVEKWSGEMIEAKKNMATAKYAISPDTLRNEPLSQKIVNCGHFLGTMLGSEDFKDDFSCH